MTATIASSDIQTSLEARVYAALVSRSLNQASLAKPQDQAQIIVWDEWLYRLHCGNLCTEFPRGVLDLFADAPLYELWQDIQTEVEAGDRAFAARTFAWWLYLQLQAVFADHPDRDLFPEALTATDLSAWEILLYEITLYLFPDIIYEPLRLSDIAEDEVTPFLDFLAIGCTRVFLMSSRILMDLPISEPGLSQVTQARIAIPAVVQSAEGIHCFRWLAHYLSGCLDGIQNISMSSRLRDIYLESYGLQALELYEAGWERIVFAQPVPTMMTIRSTLPVIGKPGRTRSAPETPVIPPRRIVKILVLPPTKDELYPEIALKPRVNPRQAPPPTHPDPSRQSVDFTRFDSDTRQRRPKRSPDHRFRSPQRRGDRIEPLLSYRQLQRMMAGDRSEYLQEWVRAIARGSRAAALVLHSLWSWELSFVQTRFPASGAIALGDVACPPNELAAQLRWPLAKLLAVLSEMELRAQVIGIRTVYVHPPGGTAMSYSPTKLKYSSPQYRDFLDRLQDSSAGTADTPIEYATLMRWLLVASHQVWGLPLTISSQPIVLKRRD